jgi:hypothetical protein
MLYKALSLTKHCRNKKKKEDENYVCEKYVRIYSSRKAGGGHSTTAPAV